MTKFQGRKGYSARHYQSLANGGPDTRRDINERLALKEVGKTVYAEIAPKFGAITHDNALEIVEWTKGRMEELMIEKGFWRRNKYGGIEQAS